MCKHALGFLIIHWAMFQLPTTATSTCDVGWQIRSVSACVSDFWQFTSNHYEPRFLAEFCSFDSLCAASFGGSIEMWRKPRFWGHLCFQHVFVAPCPMGTSTSVWVTAHFEMVKQPPSLAMLVERLEDHSYSTSPLRFTYTGFVII